MKDVKIDITYIPFSRYGAYLSVMRDTGKDDGKPGRKLIITFRPEAF